MKKTYEGRIISDPDILCGKPVIKGTRISVELVISKLADGMAIEELLEAYPSLIEEDIYSCLQYCSDILKTEETIAD